MFGALVQKAGKNAIKHWKIQSFFLSAAVFLSLVVVFFYFLVGVDLSKEKLEFISVNFTVHLHFVQCQF